MTGIPAYAGAAMPAVIPGTTSNGMEASFIACASSLPRPNTNGSPPLRRTTRFPSRASLTRSALISLWVTESFAPAALPDVIQLGPSRLPRAGRKQRRIRERVVHDCVGRVDELLPSYRDETRITGTSTHEKNLSFVHRCPDSLRSDSPTRFAHAWYSTGEISDGLISLRPPQNTFVYENRDAGFIEMLVDGRLVLEHELLVRAVRDGHDVHVRETRVRLRASRRA